MKKIKKVIKELKMKRRSVENITKEITDTYKEKKESGNENPIDETVDKIMEIIKEAPKPEETAKKILIATLEEEKLPNRVSEKLSTKISETTEISDSVITKAIEETKEDVPDEVIDRIIKEGDIKVAERHKLIKVIENEDILKQHIQNELEILYRICKDKQDREVVDRINELKNIIAKKHIDTNIEKMIEKVITKKIAENYYNDVTKGTKIYELSQAISVEKMFEKDLPEKVEEEFKKLEEKYGEKKNRYKKEELKGLILDKIAQNVAIKYKKSSIIVIPQSENMKALNEEEIKRFIKQIQTTLNKPLPNNAVTNIREQIKGNAKKNQVREHILINKIKNLNDENKQEYIEFLIRILDEQEKETLKSLAIIESSKDFMKEFNSMSTKRRKNTISVMGEVLNRKKYKVAEKTPKLKDEGKQKLQISER